MPCRGAQQPAPQQAATRFDVTNYRIEAQLIPDQHMLRAGADITFIPLEATRSLVFELNGSLKVESIDRDGKPLTGFVQDAVGVGSLGPSVRVDLGQVVPANQPLTLRFRWSGALALAGRRTAGDQAAGLCRPRRLLSDVCLALVSFSRLRRGPRHF